MKGCSYKSESLGFNVYIMHPEGLPSLMIIKKLIEKTQPELMLELGTAYGGFTALMFDACPHAKIYTFDKFFGEDIVNRSGNIISREMAIVWRKSLIKLGINFILADILIKPCFILKTLCSNNQRKILYCDNGNKPLEISTYSIFLNPGDILGVHDWQKEVYPNKEPVKSVLTAHFREHTVNEKLKEVNSQSRFFVKKQNIKSD